MVEDQGRGQPLSGRRGEAVAQFDRGEPVTTRVARQVGNILRQIGPAGAIRSRYSYFM